MTDQINVAFNQAQNFTPQNGPRRVDLIVIHCMESQEKPDTAETVAAWFASEKAPSASAHYCLDVDSIVQCVREQDIAWHAPGANAHGIGIELAGRAAQSEAEWLDMYGRTMLQRAAWLVADRCVFYGLPPVPISAPRLREYPLARGITTHAAVSAAFRKSTHTDPGPHFPAEFFFEMVREAMTARPTLTGIVVA